mmetsp:Transcript_17211/g.54312  ORF Transcript_17211/g.54312 Transcript_17211/m.54312 type:complete len:257 (+) Transcript_17211:161-931(+)
MLSACASGLGEAIPQCPTCRSAPSSGLARAGDAGRTSAQAGVARRAPGPAAFGPSGGAAALLALAALRSAAGAASPKLRQGTRPRQHRRHLLHAQALGPRRVAMTPGAAAAAAAATGVLPLAAGPWGPCCRSLPRLARGPEARPVRVDRQVRRWHRGRRHPPHPAEPRPSVLWGARAWGHEPDAAEPRREAELDHDVISIDRRSCGCENRPARQAGDWFLGRTRCAGHRAGGKAGGSGGLWMRRALRNARGRALGR